MLLKWKSTNMLLKYRHLKEIGRSMLIKIMKKCYKGRNLVLRKLLIRQKRHQNKSQQIIRQLLIKQWNKPLTTWTRHKRNRMKNQRVDGFRKIVLVNFNRPKRQLRRWSTKLRRCLMTLLIMPKRWLINLWMKSIKNWKRLISLS